jgi:hypothetical protein
MVVNPYRGLPDHQFWSRAVAWQGPGQIDPMTSDHPIAPGAKVVTMGSCFAQHIARSLHGLGLTYHVAEAPPADMPAAEAKLRNYGVFSARYGNVYTARQGRQLFERAFGHFSPVDDVWEAAGGFVDAFRPQIEPVPMANPEAVRAEASTHLACVRRMFEQADWLIFTLGLTEAWRSTLDGAVYPLAPGTAAGSFDPSRYEFVNFSAQTVRHDMQLLIDRLSIINPNCQIILTVSPVPLIATYERQHALAATVYSKSVLRVVADELSRIYSHVTYFPSFEIITSPAAGNTYYDDDMRSINEFGVQHVMRVFKRHFVSPAPDRLPEPTTRPVSLTPMDSAFRTREVVCDEEILEDALKSSGLTALRITDPAAKSAEI